MKTTIVAALAAALMSSGAYAADVYSKGGSLKDDAGEVRQNWSGVYVGGQCGYGYSSIGLEDDKGGIAVDGPLCGLRLGVDIARGNILVGVYGEYNWSGEALELGGTSVLQQDNDWAAMARLGFISGRTLFYGAGGYTEIDYSAPALGGGEVTLTGWKAAVGIEHAIAPNLTLGLEASRAWLDADDLSPGAEDFVDITDDRVLARLNYKFNGYTFGF